MKFAVEVNIMEKYKGSITREQFLFFETRTVARLLSDGMTPVEIQSEILENNLFQFPTERMVDNICRACLRRLNALDDKYLISVIGSASVSVAKQVNLYAMMRENGIVHDFMVTVIGEKYRTQNFELSKKDLNIFILELCKQNEELATWSDATWQKIRQVLMRCLVECEYVDSCRSTKLNPVWITPELLDGIHRNGDYDALAAFNCFE